MSQERSHGAAFGIGIAPVTLESAGGVFQYSQVMLSVLAEMRDARDERMVVVGDGIGARSPVLSGVAWERVPLTPPSVAGSIRRRAKRFVGQNMSPGLRDRAHKLADRALSRPSAAVVPSGARADVRRWLRHCGIDLLVFPMPDPIAAQIGLPYVISIHDLQHKLHPEFPEVSADGKAAVRERVIRESIRHAALVVADSKIGCEDILEHYGDLITPDRVVALPFLPSTLPLVEPDRSRRDKLRRRRVPERYFFYPAQFWPHKNHERLVEALALVKQEHGIQPSLVLVGSASGPLRSQHFRAVMDRAAALGVDQQVKHLGYVSPDELTALYADAVALVMPTFFGPTNIPILEAWSLDCPVLTSDIRGVREQAGDGALLVDPTSVRGLAEGLRRLWADEGLRADLRARGRTHAAAYTREDYRRCLGDILDAARSLVDERSGRPARLARA